MLMRDYSRARRSALDDGEDKDRRDNHYEEMIGLREVIREGCLQVLREKNPTQVRARMQAVLEELSGDESEDFQDQLNSPEEIA